MKEIPFKFRDYKEGIDGSCAPFALANLMNDEKIIKGFKSKSSGYTFRDLNSMVEEIFESHNIGLDTIFKDVRPRGIYNHTLQEIAELQRSGNKSFVSVYMIDIAKKVTKEARKGHSAVLIHDDESFYIVDGANKGVLWYPREMIVEFLHEFDIYGLHRFYDLTTNETTFFAKSSLSHLI